MSCRKSGSYLTNLVIMTLTISWVVQDVASKPSLFEGKSKGQPLYLTPYIESKQLAKGRQLARVTDLDWKMTSYSGLLTVDKALNSSMFFWYFPSERKPDEVPLLIWLNGFSTASTYGLFLQNGPFDLNGGPELVPRYYSWQKYYHVVYIDNPVGVGFSHTGSEKGYSKTFEDVGNNLYGALDQFLQLFPQLNSNELYISGLSLGGKYIFSMVATMMKRNAFNLKGLFVGNPLLDPYVQLNYGDYLLQLGFVDAKQKALIDTIEADIKRKLAANDYEGAYNASQPFFLDDQNLLTNITGLNSLYDYNAPYINPSYYEHYISQIKVRQALHVGSIEFDDGSKAMNEAPEVFTKSITDVIAQSLKHYKVLIYAGQMDVICAYPMLVNVLESVDWSGKEAYVGASRQKLYSDDRQYVWGLLRNYDNLTDVMVRNASHSAVTNQPKYVLELLFNFTDYSRF